MANFYYEASSTCIASANETLTNDLQCACKNNLDVKKKKFAPTDLASVVR